MKNLFLEATKNKYRFATSKGQISTEDLWDLSLTSLDNIAIFIDEKLQKTQRKSFIDRRSTDAVELDNQLELVKSIIEYKQKENEAAKVRADANAKKALLKELLEKKQLEKLGNMTEEEIQAQLASL